MVCHNTHFDLDLKNESYRTIWCWQSASKGLTTFKRGQYTDFGEF